MIKIPKQGEIKITKQLQVMCEQIICFWFLFEIWILYFVIYL